jgi:hypothetical protein
MYLRQRTMGLENSIKLMLSASRNGNERPSSVGHIMSSNEYSLVFEAFKRLNRFHRLRLRYQYYEVESAYKIQVGNTSV